MYMCTSVRLDTHAHVVLVSGFHCLLYASSAMPPPTTPVWLSLPPCYTYFYLLGYLQTLLCVQEDGHSTDTEIGIKA